MDFVSQAWAQVGGAAPEASAGLLSLIPFVLIFVVFYFLLILPQQRRKKQQQELLDAIKKDDKVITSSGIWGTVTNMDKETKTVTLQVADNTKIRLQRDHISGLQPPRGGGGQ